MQTEERDDNNSNTIVSDLTETINSKSIPNDSLNSHCPTALQDDAPHESITESVNNNSRVTATIAQQVNSRIF